MGTTKTARLEFPLIRGIANDRRAHDDGCIAYKGDPVGRLPYALGIAHGHSVGVRDFSAFMIRVDRDIQNPLPPYVAHMTTSRLMLGNWCRGAGAHFGETRF